MTNYDTSIYKGVHTVKITIQCREYVGHITYKVCGSCRGRDILFEFDFENEDLPLENDCDLQFDEDSEYFSARLTAPNGNKLIVEGEGSEFNDMIVAAEIIDFVEE